MNCVASLGQLAITSAIPDRVIARREQTAIYHADLRERVAAWAATLQRQPHTECALSLRDGFEFTCALLGAWHAGKTVWLPGDTQPATIDALRRSVKCFIGDFPGTVALRLPDTNGTTLHEIPPEHPALRVFTSGSTGQPSIIPKTLRQLDAEVSGMQSQWGALVKDAIIISTVPHHHFYGLLFKLLWPLCRGTAFASASVDYPEEVCAAAAMAPCIIISSPALLSRLPTLEWPGKNLRAVFSAGSPLSKEAASHCAQLLGCWPEEVFGSSETGVVARRTQQTSPAYWQCMPGVRVTREQTSGQLEVHSPWLEAPPCLLADRGDTFEDGRFHLLGRADRIVKIAEKRISLDAQEQALKSAPEVESARVLPLEGRLAAVVVLTPAGRAKLESQGQRALCDRLREHLTHHVERVALPRRWRFVTELPVNALGKITHAGLLTLFGEQKRPCSPVIRNEIREEDGIRLSLLVPPELFYFDGHFPGAPILPGVVQVDWAIEFGRRLLGVNGPFLRLEQIKFQKTIRPGMEVEMLLRSLPVKSAVEFKITSAADAHSSGRIIFGA